MVKLIFELTFLCKVRKVEFKNYTNLLFTLYSIRNSGNSGFKYKNQSQGIELIIKVS